MKHEYAPCFLPGHPVVLPSVLGLLSPDTIRCYLIVESEPPESREPLVKEPLVAFILLKQQLAQLYWLACFVCVCLRLVIDQNIASYFVN